MICIEDEKLERLAPHWAEIQCLKFTIPADKDQLIYSFFFHNSGLFMGVFAVRQELHMVIQDYIGLWSTTFEACFYSCLRKNVRFLDPQSGLLLNGFQLEMAYLWGVENERLVRDEDDVDTEVMWILEDKCDVKLNKLVEIE